MKDMIETDADLVRTIDELKYCLKGQPLSTLKDKFNNLLNTFITDNNLNQDKDFFASLPRSDYRPETICYINPITKEIRYILEGHEGPIDIVHVSGTNLKKRVRYIPYAEYLKSIEKPDINIAEKDD